MPGMPPATSPRAIHPKDEDGNASVPSRDQWRCCSTCFNYNPDFISSFRNEPHEDGWQRTRGPPVSHFKPLGPHDDSWQTTRGLLMSHFKASAARGCDLCSIIYRGCLKAFPDVAITNSMVQLRISKQALSVRIHTPGFHTPGTWQSVDFHAMPGLHPRWYTLEPKEYLSRSLLDSQCFNRIRKWLRVCETTHNHSACRQRAECPLPHRVITIQPTNGLPKLHLHETNGTTGKFIALSHCWGGFKGCQSTTSNYAGPINGIEFADLPRTFQDTVTIALELSVFHIWIDSLCIIQDDKDDWERESAKMSKVYSNAYLVLAAASADADDKGFFTIPDSIYRGIGLESEEGSGRDDLVMHIDPEHEPHPADMFSPTPLSPISLGPLGNRAWTLQETILARRCIGFNQNEIAWECYSAIDCECGINRTVPVSEHASKQNTSQIRYQVSSKGIFGNVSAPRLHCRPLSQFADIATTYLEWRMMIVPNYTRRRLTFPGDKLPALSALANTVGTWSRDQYLAGIWLADIKLGLAWRVKERWHDASLPAPSTWVSPSFSWASVDEKIDYVLPDPIPGDGSSPYGSVNVNVLEYDIELSGLNPYGAVNSGWVKLSALSQTFKLQWDSTKKEYTLINVSKNRLKRPNFHPDAILRESRIKGPGKEEYVSVLRSTSRNNDQASFNIRVQGALILDVPDRPVVGWTTRSSHGHQIAIMVLGLFSTSPHRYQRIGLATLSFKPGSAEKWLESLTRKEFIIV